MPLHTMYRPQTLDELIGNDEVKLKLQSLLARTEDIPHSFLFHGSSGTGKTTLARIVAYALGCTPQNIIEINMSDDTGVDSARHIIRQLQYKNLVGNGIKFFILDEVQMSTKNFQSAMLKATEEPPDHVYFAFCTTDPQKLLPTLRNRCSQFEMSLFNTYNMKEMLNWVLKGEDATITKKAMEGIIEAAEGCPRAALVMLDQIIDMTDEEQDQVNFTLVGEAENPQAIELARAVFQGRHWPGELLKDMKDANHEQLRKVILGYIRTVCLDKPNARAALIYEAFKEPFYSDSYAKLVLSCNLVFID